MVVASGTERRCCPIRSNQSHSFRPADFSDSVERKVSKPHRDVASFAGRNGEQQFVVFASVERQIERICCTRPAGGCKLRPRNQVGPDAGADAARFTEVGKVRREPVADVDKRGGQALAREVAAQSATRFGIKVSPDGSAALRARSPARLKQPEAQRRKPEPPAHINLVAGAGARAAKLPAKL